MYVPTVLTLAQPRREPPPAAASGRSAVARAIRPGANRRIARLAFVAAIGAPAALAAEPGFAFGEARGFLGEYCDTCHQGEDAPSGFRTDTLDIVESFRTRSKSWVRLADRVANGEMPPRGAPAPSGEVRLRFVEWARDAWRGQACSIDLEPARVPYRRLNSDEYAATVRDLFDIQIDVSAMLPADGPGGEGFDNAAETLFVSPLLTEKHLEAAKLATDVASKEFKSRRRLFVTRPGPGVTEREAARRVLASFLPRAFRRPVDEDTVDFYANLFRAARGRGLDFEPAVYFALRGALASPSFLFHATASEAEPSSRQYALASRLSYFLWGSMPDELLFDIAASGKMDDPDVLRRLVPRMLRDPRSLQFATRFVEQWLRTRELERGGPAPDLFPEYAASAELRGDILLQPVFFFREVFRENRSLLDFLDSDGTVLTRNLIEHLGLPMKKAQDAKNPNWMELPEGVDRGGLLAMPAVAAVGSHPHRTSPVLRGVWILDSILGTPPPPPPPDVPELEEAAQDGGGSLRELLAAHSRNPACAGCHERIDPLGFALENYDVVGRWRDSDGGLPVDASGTLSDGTRIEGPQELKRALLSRKRLFVRNLAKRMLGYALGRGLTPSDDCAVETIIENVEREDYKAWSLVRQVALSAPFLDAPAGGSGSRRSE